MQVNIRTLPVLRNRLPNAPSLAPKSSLLTHIPFLVTISCSFLSSRSLCYLSAVRSETPVSNGLSSRLRRSHAFGTSSPFLIDHGAISRTPSHSLLSIAPRVRPPHARSMQLFYAFLSRKYLSRCNHGVCYSFFPPLSSCSAEPFFLHAQRRKRINTWHPFPHVNYVYLFAWN